MGSETNNKKLMKLVVSSSLLTSAMTASMAYAQESVSPVQVSELTKASDLASSAIQRLLAEGILDGDSAGQANASAKITRLQTVAMLARSLGLKADNVAASSFRDVSADSWGLPYLEALAKIGIIQGSGEGRFRPNDPITREELAAIFARIHQVNVTGKGANLNIKDAGQISDWAKPYVQAVIEAGLLTPTNGEFGAKQELTRDIVAVVTNQLISSDKFNTLKEKISTLFKEGKPLSSSDPS